MQPGPAHAFHTHTPHHTQTHTRAFATASPDFLLDPHQQLARTRFPRGILQVDEPVALLQTIKPDARPSSQLVLDQTFVLDFESVHRDVLSATVPSVSRCHPTWSTVMRCHLAVHQSQAGNATPTAYCRISFGEPQDGGTDEAHPQGSQSAHPQKEKATGHTDSTLVLRITKGERKRPLCK